jgi:hypothetical protein
MTKTNKKETYKCRQNTCLIRVTKQARLNLRKLAIKRGLSIQELVEKLSTV